MVQKAKVSNAFREVFKSKPTATLLDTTIRSLRCLELSTSLTYCWVETIILAEQNSRKSRIFNSNFTSLFYHCRIELFKKEFLHASGVKVVGLSFRISLAVSDIWVGWSDSVLYRNTPQLQQLPPYPGDYLEQRFQSRSGITLVKSSTCSWLALLFLPLSTLCVFSIFLFYQEFLFQACC